MWNMESTPKIVLNKVKSTRQWNIFVRRISKMVMYFLRIFLTKESKACIQLSLSIHQESRDQIRPNPPKNKNNLLKWDEQCSQ